MIPGKLITLTLDLESLILHPSDVTLSINPKRSPSPSWPRLRQPRLGLSGLSKTLPIAIKTNNEKIKFEESVQNKKKASKKGRSYHTHQNHHGWVAHVCNAPSMKVALSQLLSSLIPYPANLCNTGQKTSKTAPLLTCVGAHWHHGLHPWTQLRLIYAVVIMVLSRVA